MFFLRFYNYPQSKVDECLDRIRTETKANFRVEKSPVTKSVNMFIGAFTGENTEAHLIFKTEDECLACYRNPRTFEIYKEYSHGGIAVKRKPKDVAYS